MLMEHKSQSNTAKATHDHHRTMSTHANTIFTEKITSQFNHSLLVKCAMKIITGEITHINWHQLILDILNTQQITKQELIDYLDISPKTFSRFLTLETQKPHWTTRLHLLLLHEAFS